MAKQKTSNGAKAFTIAFCTLLAVLLIGSIIFLTTSPDFMKPLTFKIDNDSYGYTLDEFAAYLQEKEALPAGEGTAETIEGVAEAKRYGDTLLIRYDTEDAAWKTIANIGNDTLENGEWMVVYGQFGVSNVDPQNTDSICKTLEAFPMEFSGNHGNKTVWDCTFEEFKAYMIEKGIFLENNWTLMMTIGTESWINNGIDIMWWDVPGLVDGTEESDYWNSMQEDGYMMIGDYVYLPQLNGPFGIHVNGNCPLDADYVYDTFAAFPGN